MTKKQEIGNYDDRTSQLMNLRAEAERKLNKNGLKIF